MSAQQKHTPDPEFVEYLTNEVRNPFLSSQTVLRMEQAFIAARERYQAARAQGGQGAREASSSDAPAYLWDQTERDAWAIGRNAHPPSTPNQGGVPEGWRIRRMPYDTLEAGKIQVDSPDDHHCMLERRGQMAPHHPMNMFYALAESLLTTSPNKPEQEGVPEGWKLVPIESTSEMDIAGMDSLHNSYEGYIIDREAAEIIWNAMLDASPQPPQEQRGAE